MLKIYYDRKDRPHLMPEGRTASKRISLYGIIIADGKVLLVKPEDLEDWEFPGGGKEAHETEAEALFREVLEEANYRVLVIGECVKIKEKLFYADDLDQFFDATQKFYLITAFEPNTSEKPESEIVAVELFDLADAVKAIRANQRDVMQALVAAGIFDPHLAE